MCTPLKGFSLCSETVVPGGCLRSLSSSFHHPSVVMSAKWRWCNSWQDGLSCCDSFHWTVFKTFKICDILHGYSLTGSQWNGCTGRTSRWRINVFTCDSNAEIAWALVLLKDRWFPGLPVWVASGSVSRQEHTPSRWTQCCCASRVINGCQSWVS